MRMGSCAAVQREEENSTGRAGPLPEGRALPPGRGLFEVIDARSGFSLGLVLSCL